MDFSERLKTLRKQRDISQAKVAEAVGLSIMQCRRYEAGTSEPTLSKLTKLADFFGVSIDYLIGRVDAPLPLEDKESGETTTRRSTSCQPIDSNFMSLFSARLQKCRQEKGLTQKQMAKIYGISERSWQAYEGGKHMPDAQGLMQLADFFGVSTDYLLGRTDDPQ